MESRDLPQTCSSAGRTSASRALRPRRSPEQREQPDDEDRDDEDRYRQQRVDLVLFEARFLVNRSMFRHRTSVSGCQREARLARCRAPTAAVDPVECLRRQVAFAKLECARSTSVRAMSRRALVSLTARDGRAADLGRSHACDTHARPGPRRRWRTRYGSRCRTARREAYARASAEASTPITRVSALVRATWSEYRPSPVPASTTVRGNARASSRS